MLVDIGLNLTSSRFADDTEAVLTRAVAAGVQQFVVTGTNVEESRAAIALCQQYAQFQLVSTAGVHPHHASDVAPEFITQLKALAKHACVRAIGECGLDYNRNFSTPADQRRVFEQQLQLAVACQLPVFLHQRDAFADWFDILSCYLPALPGAVSHCFTGSETELQRCLDAGLSIGITGWICDERRGQELFSIVGQIPLDQLMIETDAPYLTPRTIRPKPKSSRNEPAFLTWVLDKVAQAYQCDATVIATATRANSQRFFGLPEC